MCRVRHWLCLGTVLLTFAGCGSCGGTDDDDNDTGSGNTTAQDASAGWGDAAGHDGNVAVEDASVEPMDASVVAGDGGTSTRDAAVSQRDASTQPRDSGPSTVDASVTVRDAGGTMDAAVTPTDAGISGRDGARPEGWSPFSTEMGCQLPVNFRSPPPGAESFITVTFNGVVSDPTEELIYAPGSAILKLRGAEIPASQGEFHAVYVYSNPRVTLKATFPADNSDSIYYAEFRTTVIDLQRMEAEGEHLLDLYDPETEGDTKMMLYRVWLDENRNPEKLCVEGVTGEFAEFYLCNTAIDFMTNVGEPYSMAANVNIFDDTDYIKQSQGMLCMCPNGAGSWRNCDDGVPNAYGLLRFTFKLPPPEDPTAYFSKYIFDEAQLWNGNEINTTYVNSHPAGLWEDNYAPFSGGLNIGSYSVFQDEGLYRFEYSVPGVDKVITLVSHDNINHRIIVRMQSFNKSDNTPGGLWAHMFFPDTVTKDQVLQFGSETGQAQLFLFNPNQNQCVMAVACGVGPKVLEAEGLTLSEGGKIRLYSEDNGTTRYTVELHHPDEVPSACSFTAYLEAAGMSPQVDICNKW